MGDLDALVDALTDLLDEWEQEDGIDGDETMEYFLATSLVRDGWTFNPPSDASNTRDEAS